MAEDRKQMGMKEELERFLGELQEISEEHEETMDTDVREALHRTLNRFFVWGAPRDRLPIQYAMFSAEGDRRVAAAVEAFLIRALATSEARNASAGKERLDLLQDRRVRTHGGFEYDDFLGHVDNPLPDQPLPESWFEPQDHPDRE
jgi:hypothetical protein